MTCDPHPFQTLTPGFVMDAVESQGYLCDCRTLALNSYENRVYQVGIEGQDPLVAKFYRPERWTDIQIHEEHQFCFELIEHELPVVAPLVNAEGESLFSFGGFRFALYPRRGGHAPELDNPDNLLILGRLMGRIHAVGAVRPFEARPCLDSNSFGHDAVAVVSERYVPQEFKGHYDALTRDLLQGIEDILSRSGQVQYIRTHGDCHPGNILWRDGGPHFVDFDDARMAPAVQDLWMMLSGDRAAKTAQLSEILDGYTEFNDFDARELQLVEALRSLRIIHFTAWLAQRWEDPAFPPSFPWFNTPRYWGDHILELREQIAAVQEPALQV
ncbi:protein serine/threonine kinase [Syntrophotalea carbinolica DSM 2380]|uniref:Stress response kinase A n=1 Tax=Syntrophotalea carbinolica (strain DSM 2380 / NBRC 103641 / GraBd1) TaxID=338963 RepID=Q3A1B4_SYNC1|nr:serine/threonine protein kinase [Syntrophotalea carbinolica]ABA89843.1 protein serine/threonine kinase [Syntrophotalea carbinolica DSM 2380]